METTPDVLLKDVIHLLRRRFIALPSGFTKQGHPIVFFPNNESASSSSSGAALLSDSDLLILLHYILAFVPKSKQDSGFSILIDRRGSDVQNIFQRIVSLFPARIREVYLLSNGERANSQEEFLLDFDIFTLDSPAQLYHYIDAKYLHFSLGGSLRDSDTETWLRLQEHVESFSFKARIIARQLSQFVGVLNIDEIKNESLWNIASKNRNDYRYLKKELENLTDHGFVMLKSLQRPDANVMQRLAVQILCKQLDEAWTYFNRSWKNQDHVYVQYLELNTFQQQFRELSNSFGENERKIANIPISGSTTEELNTALDKLDSCCETLETDGFKAMELIKIGQELLAFHNFSDCISPKISELKSMTQKLETDLLNKRRVLHRFLELLESLDDICKWNSTVEDIFQPNNSSVDLLSQIRQIDYLLSKSRELKIKSRTDFEEYFEEIKDLISASTLFSLDDALEQFIAVSHRIVYYRDELRSKATRMDSSYSNDDLNICPSNDSMTTRRENIMRELLTTESNYVSDLESTLFYYKDKLTAEGNSKATSLFGNLDEIYEFHASTFYPDLEACRYNPVQIALTFNSVSADLKDLYTTYCIHMASSQQAIEDIGGENPPSLLFEIQREAAQPLPLSSYLLKPIQRLTKYQLMLKELFESSSLLTGKEELQDALSSLLTVIQLVNDSLITNGSIQGLPESLIPLGSLLRTDVVHVVRVNKKSQSQILFRTRSPRRTVFLYENHLVFCKGTPEKTNKYNMFFKFSLGTSSLGMSSSVKGDERKIELWIQGRSEIYTLEAKTKGIKDEIAAELRRLILRQKDRILGHSESLSYESGGSTSNSSGMESKYRLHRSRSLENAKGQIARRSRSLDIGVDRSSPDNEAPSSKRYLVLADYMALTSREIDLNEDDFVELVKIGCAGWWYVRLSSYPYQEGWAPSTYLEKLPG